MIARRRHVVIGAVALALVAALVAVGVIALGGGSRLTEPGDGPAPLPAGDSGRGSVPVDESAVATASPVEGGPVDPSLTAEDPVPDDLVELFFIMIEEAGKTPVANKTYTVEFDGSTDKVRIEGEFQEGSAEFEFEYEDGNWKIEESL